MGLRDANTIISSSVFSLRFALHFNWQKELSFKTITWSSIFFSLLFVASAIPSSLPFSFLFALFIFETFENCLFANVHYEYISLLCNLCKITGNSTFAGRRKLYYRQLQLCATVCVYSLHNNDNPISHSLRFALSCPTDLHACRHDDRVYVYPSIVIFLKLFAFFWAIRIFILLRNFGWSCCFCCCRWFSSPCFILLYLVSCCSMRLRTHRK